MNYDAVEQQRKSFYRNEVEANQQMCLVSAFAAGFLLVAFIFYVFRLFPLNSYTTVYIAMPIEIVVLALPLIYRKTKFVEKPGFKYFIILQLLFVVGALNIVVPKHGIMAYALIIVLANHYYSPKLTKVIFFITLGFMLLCLYAGMFLGEYDPNLLTSGILRYDEEGVAYLYQPDSPIERYEMLAELKAMGSNRYAKVLAYYYFGRATTLTLIFLASLGLSRRTSKMMDREVLNTIERSRLSTELTVAQQVQSEMVPQPCVQNDRYEIIAQLRPARFVGGDFYDYSPLDESHVALLIGDVSGKGIPAAMFMMKAVTSFRAYYRDTSSPKQIMEKVNRLIYQGNEEAGMFVTCFLAILDLNSGVMTYANAGHNPPLLRRNGKFAPLPCSHGFLMGAMPDAIVRDETMMLRDGDGLVLYTDGITEARRGDGELYGEERMLSFLNSAQCNSLVEFSHELEDDVLEFVEGAEQSDDITYLFFRYQGEKMSFSEKRFPAELDQINEIGAWLKSLQKEYKLTDRLIDNYMICVDEIFSNVIKYAGVKPEDEVYLRLVVRPDANSSTLTIIDRGSPFDPRNIQAIPVDQRDDDAPVGGLGWLMVRNLMDELAYHRVNGKNVVSITAKLSK